MTMRDSDKSWHHLPFCALSLLLLVSCGESPVQLGHGYARRGEYIHFEGGGSTGAAGGTRIDRPSKANIEGFQDALRRPLTLCTSPDAASFEALSEEYCRDRNKVAETILYELETRRSLAIVRADLTERGMRNLQLSPAPGAEAAGTVPAWQIDIFERPDLAMSLRAMAQRFLR